MNPTSDSQILAFQQTDLIVLSLEHPQVFWAPSMDFLGMISTIDQKLELYRVGFQQQRIFVKEEEVAPTMMQFSQDGQFIVMGYKDGRVSLFKSDSSLDEIFSTKIQDDGSPITAINIKQYEQFKSKYLNLDVGALHLKSPMLNDKKRSANQEKMRLLTSITDLNQSKSYIVLAADEKLSIIAMYQGSFPIASLNYKDILSPKLFDASLNLAIKGIYPNDCCSQIITHNIVRSKDGKFQGSFMLNIDSHVIHSKVLQSDSCTKIFQNLPIIEDKLKYLDLLTADCQKLWSTANAQYQRLMNPLKQGIIQNHISQELTDLLVRGKMSITLQNYFTTNIYNTKALQNCDENLQLLFTSLEEEMLTKMIPTAESILQQLSELRGISKAKQMQIYNTQQTSQGLQFPLSESMLVKMIDFMEYYYHELSVLHRNIVDLKRNIRNLLVFFNSMVIRLANATVNIDVEPRDENNRTSPRPSPADIENSKSQLALMQFEKTKLLEFLEKGDSFILMVPITKMLEEGQFKLPIDVENQIVSGFACEDLHKTIQLMEKIEEEKENKQQQQAQSLRPQQTINIQQANAPSTMQIQARRTTRRQHLQSSDFNSSRIPTYTIQQRSQPQVQAQPQQDQCSHQASQLGFTMIPLKTLTTRIMDLVHKQMRKPLETFSPYFRYTQLLYFENQEDVVRDVIITDSKCSRNNTLLISYQIGDKYLMIIEWDLNSSEKKRGRKLTLKYYIMQLMDNYKIKDALIHFNTLMISQEDHVSEELFIMCESLSDEETIIQLQPLDPLQQEFAFEETVSLDSQNGFKFGTFAREALQRALNENRVPVVEFDQTANRIQGRNLRDFRISTRRLFSVFLSEREMIVRDYE